MFAFDFHAATKLKAKKSCLCYVVVLSIDTIYILFIFFVPSIRIKNKERYLRTETYARINAYWGKNEEKIGKKNQRKMGKGWTLLWIKFF